MNGDASCPPLRANLQTRLPRSPLSSTRLRAVFIYPSPAFHPMASGAMWLLCWSPDPPPIPPPLPSLCAAAMRLPELPALTPPHPSTAHSLPEGIGTVPFLRLAPFRGQSDDKYLRGTPPRPSASPQGPLRLSSPLPSEPLVPGVPDPCTLHRRGRGLGVRRPLSPPCSPILSISFARPRPPSPMFRCLPHWTNRARRLLQFPPASLMGMVPNRSPIRAPRSPNSVSEPPAGGCQSETSAACP